jgi:hypothetical protein
MYVNGNCWYRQASTAVHSKHIIVTVNEMLFLGILWVRTKNSGLMQESDTLRNSTCIDFMDNLSGPEEMNNSCRKMTFGNNG